MHVGFRCLCLYCNHLPSAKVHIVATFHDFAATFLWQAGWVFQEFCEFWMQELSSRNAPNRDIHKLLGRPNADGEFGQFGPFTLVIDAQD